MSGKVAAILMGGGSNYRTSETVLMSEGCELAAERATDTGWVESEESLTSVSISLVLFPLPPTHSPCSYACHPPPPPSTSSLPSISSPSPSRLLTGEGLTGEGLRGPTCTSTCTWRQSSSGSTTSVFACPKNLRLQECLVPIFPRGVLMIEA